MNHPKISVVMPVYNSAEYLSASLDSILKQTFSDFELIVVDDGSTDDSIKILQTCRDPRVRVLANSRNLGIPQTLNRGLDASCGVYVARMDADDISFPQRFERQVVHMDTHPEIGLLGTAVQHIGAWSGCRDERLVRPGPCAAYLLFATPVAHPTVMIRRSFLTSNHLRYHESFKSAQDYELWTRISEVSGVANLSDVLLSYRMHKKNVTSRYSDETTGRVKQVMTRQLLRMGITPTEDELARHWRIANSHRVHSQNELVLCLQWLERIQAANASRCIVSERDLDEALAFVWFRLLANCGNLGLRRNAVHLQCRFRHAWQPSLRRMFCSFLSMWFHSGFRLIAKKGRYENSFL